MARLREIATAQARNAVDHGALHSRRIASWALNSKLDRHRGQDWELRFVADLPRGQLAVDVGAHIGMITTLLASSHDQVIALEPNPTCVHRLLQTVPGNVTVVGAAAGDVGGTIELRVPQIGGRTVAALGSVIHPTTTENRYQTHRVMTIRIDDIVPGRVDFLKIDVEGFEPEVLAGAARVLQGQPTVLIEAEERHRAGAPSKVAEILSAYDLTGFFFDGTHVREFTDFDPKIHQANVPGVDGKMPQGYVANFVFVAPDGADECAHRLARAANVSRTTSDQS